MSKEHVFIVTYGRSGSTVLQRVLQTIPGSCIRGENNNVLFHIYKACESLRTAIKAYGSWNQKAQDPWWGINQANLPAFKKRLIEAFVEDVLAPDSDVGIVGFKEIRYHETGTELVPFLEFIRESFPNSRIIFLTRDHRQVVKSGWWASRDSASVYRLLERSERSFREFAETHPDISFAITFDDLVSGTDRIGEMFKFLAKEPDMAAISRILSEKLDHARTDMSTPDTPSV